MNPYKIPDEHERRLACTLDHLSKIIIPIPPKVVSSKVIPNCDFLAADIYIELQRIIYESTTLMNKMSDDHVLQSSSSS